MTAPSATEPSTQPQVVRRVMVGTDRSRTADIAVRWAANLAASYRAELLVVQVILAPEGEAIPDEQLQEATADLQRFARELAGDQGRALVVVHDDPASAILETVDGEHVDVLVVGNVGMSGRKEFLLGNIPNRISHSARCTIVIVNTAGTEGQTTAEQARREAGEHAGPLEGDLLRRAWHIGRVMARTGAREMLSRSHGGDAEDETVLARRLTEALDQLGPTFAKLGQILSTRPDLLPPAFVQELATLQERVTPLTEAEVVAAMERELGVPWEDVFDSIDPAPLAAGTIAQVHRATLESGERVVVKIQRPTAERDIMQDLGLLEMFARRAANRQGLRQVFDIPGILEHLSSSLRRELDFREEAGNILRMHDVLKPYSKLDVPAVYQEYSTARLLVMQEIQGVPLHEAPEGPDRKEAARQLVESYYHQVMDEGFFHADPHPGNMKWWNDMIYMLDLGMVGEVDAEIRNLTLLLLLAFTERDSGFVSEIVLMLASLAGSQTDVDMERFQADVQGLITKYRDLALKDMQLGPMLQEVAEIAIRHNLRIPPALTLMAKAFAQMQLAAAELDPLLDPFKVAQSFMMHRAMRQVLHSVNPQNMFYEAQKARVRLTRLLEAVEGVVGARPGHHLQVDFRGTENLEEIVYNATKQVSVAITVGGTLAATALSANSERAPRWLPAVIGGIGSLVTGGLFLRKPRHKD